MAYLQQGLQNEANSAGIRPALTKRTQFIGDVVDDLVESNLFDAGAAVLVAASL